MMGALLVAFLAGVGFHAVLVAVALGPWAIARSAGRGRADLRPAMTRRPFVPPSSAGVVVVRRRGIDKEAGHAD